MAVTATSLKDRFAVFDPLSDAVVEAAITEAELFVNETAWGDKYDTGVLYRAAHILELDSAGATAAPGPVSSEKLLSYSVSYDGTSMDAADSNLASTAYGRRFIEARSTIFAPRVA